MRDNLPADQWRKSSYSNGGSGDCVETQRTDDGLVAFGDSKDRALGAFVVSPGGWSTFLTALRTDTLHH